ncbi:eukaryotic translation initiation factor 4E member 2 [Pyrrhoderma noxium]|uniref:Eukaryotic translation initiation factor 4E member 2 n=1 Tax=Pyrrhoderma noxium TaxID=2282107 RepID=A0A286UJ26_9AGAM|nr:eukaryotic translation initiation factor 4E member 2 [Pyrrhoderma noxium]
MTGYFSNHSHSQSRFLANSSSASVSNIMSTTTTTTATAAASQPQSNRPHAPSSKHFSTSVSTSSSGDEKPSNRDKHAVNGAINGLSSANLHPLRNTWVFWFRQQRTPGNKIVNYEEGIKRISSFASIESFWNIWTHLNPLQKPVWEDPLNLQGGKWIIRLKKGTADRLWEELVLAVVGDQFDDCGPSSVGGFGGTPTGAADVPSWRSGAGTGSAGVETSTATGPNGTANNPASSLSEPEICGCTLSVRQHEDIVSVWNKHGFDSRVNQRIKETIKKVLDLPPNTVLEYKTNNDSMQDKSSFRQPQPQAERAIQS